MKCWAPLGVGLSLFALPTIGQDVAKDVPPSHWAYAAVMDLAAKGLIKGYPADGNFAGGRALTRYEMATVIERVLAHFDDLVAKAGKGDGVSKAELEKLATSIQEIKDLTDEFKKELLVIGSDLSQAKTDIASLKTMVDDLASKVSGLSDKIAAAERHAAEARAAGDRAVAAVDDLKKSTEAQLDKKVSVGNSPSDLAKKYNLRLFGDIQTWYLNPLGKTAGGTVPGTTAIPPGRNYYGGVGDFFRIRRAELGFTGNPAPKVDFYFLFDLCKIPALTGTSSLTSIGANAAQGILQDAFTGYQATPRLRFEAGAQKTGMSEEGNRSSLALYTIERSIMNGLPTSAGRIGYIRDTGAVMRYKAPIGNINLGIWNSNGATQNTIDSDRTKFANVVANYTGTRNLIAGLFGGTNVDNVHPKPSQDRAGYTFLYHNGRHFFESEGAYTLDQSAVPGVAGRSIGLGAYGLYAYSLTRKWQFVAKVDEWDPSVHGSSAGGVALGGYSHHNLNEYTLGVNYYLTGDGSYLNQANSKVQLNFIDEDTQHNGDAFWGIRRQMILTGYSVGF